MKNEIFSSLQTREIFHIELLRWFGRRVRPELYAVKGGVNLRLFFKSFRYSEDLDLDIKGVSVNALKKAVLDVLQSRSFIESFKPFGIDRIVSPDMAKAKQTPTTQRFKIHLITAAGEDLYTKVEFSKRGFFGDILVEAVSDPVLRAYKLSPLLAPHYDARSAIAQKVLALATRSSIQARDIFDLYLLNTQVNPASLKEIKLENEIIKKAHENVYEVSIGQFRDTVLSYLTGEDRETYSSGEAWDQIKLKAAHLIGSLRDQDV